MDTIAVSKLSEVSVPSYLSCFETDFNKIHLIYVKKPSITSDNERNSPLKEKNLLYENSIKEETIEECDLTGDPLKVDLGEDDILIDNVDQVVHMWSNEELKHYPLDVKQARRELNRILKKPEPDPDNLPIYIICNGGDPYSTVVLGAHRKTLMSCGVHALGIIELNKDNEINIDEMVEDHCNNNCLREDIEIKYLVKIKYNIYGKSLHKLPNQNAAMRDLERHGSVSVDVISHQRIFSSLEDVKCNMIMNLEVIGGHKLLRLNFLWKELCILQSYLDIISDSQLSTNEDTPLCDCPLDSDVILQRITNLVTTRFVRPPPKKDCIDLDNLRNEDFLDGLWNILKYCENISVLRNSFHYLFEEIANGNIQVINIKDKYSNIAFIIDGILKRNVVLSAITLPQCVELLFELGAQKLKFDFQVILDHFSSTARSSIEAVWKKFNQTEKEKTQNTVRATRVTQYLNLASSVTKSKQLAYLCQLYVGSEFIYLVKEQVYLKEDTYYAFCQQVEKQYVENPNVYEDFLEVYQTPLCEMSFNIDIADSSIIKSVFPSRWTIYMTSEVNSTQVTTIYDLSEYPIFPPGIYNYDVPIANKNMVYFAFKMNRMKDIAAGEN